MASHSAEVATDFRDALQDLKINSRPEISNLTVIAKENTEHAQAISRELENHIRATRPEWKLPALYVLDSIVKNVGSPYTVYLGRNLYRTFMDAYTLVDLTTRKAMEGLLKTWKLPVPDSLDQRSVFSVDVTREIENALIKYRTVAVQHQQQQARFQRQHYSILPTRTSQNAAPSNPGSWPPGQSVDSILTNLATTTTTTTTLPATAATSVAAAAAVSSGTIPVTSVAPISYASLIAGDSGMINSNPGIICGGSVTNNSHAITNIPLMPLSGSDTLLGQPLNLASVLSSVANLQSVASMYPPAVSALPIVVDIVKLKESVKRLIVTATLEVTARPTDERTKQLLTTLLGLQKLLDTSNILPEQAQQIKVEVDRISAAFCSNATKPHSVGSGGSSLTSTGGSAVPCLGTVSSATGFVAARNLPLVNPGPSVSLVSNDPTDLSQILRRIAPPSSGMTDVRGSMNCNGQVVENSLLASLRASGLISGSLAGLNEESMDVSASRSSVKLDSASLKISRPNLIALLYTSKPDQCRECGRRFPATEEGKNMKVKHLDWHFNVNMRVFSDTKVVVSRSWYIDEMEWIKYKEDNEISEPKITMEANGNIVKEAPKVQFVPVPTDASQATAHCPICQEKFEVEWHKEVEQPVWIDATHVAGRTYHASCYEELSKGSSMGVKVRNGGASSGSGDSESALNTVLGKRKWNKTFGDS